MRIGFIGLGNMGKAMALHCLRAGHTLSVYNRTLELAKPLEKEGAKICESPASAAERADIVITMLSDDAVTESITLGKKGRPGFLETMPEGSIHIAMSTLSPALTARLAQAHSDRRQGYVAAPVFGRPEAAAEKKLWIVAAGQTSYINRCRPVFDAIGQGTFVVSETPAVANTIKLAGNFLIASTLEALGEAFALVRKAGVDPKLFLELINSALFKSPLYASYGSVIAEEKFDPAGFTLALGLKDVRLMLQTADAAEVPMPLASLIHDRALSGVARGMADLDWASVAQLCAEDAGIPPKSRR